MRTLRRRRSTRTYWPNDCSAWLRRTTPWHDGGDRRPARVSVLSEACENLDVFGAEYHIRKTDAAWHGAASYGPNARETRTRSSYELRPRGTFHWQHDQADES